MEKELAIYISAASEMDAECELVGQVLASMTQSVRWTIKRTPRPPEGEDPDLERLRASQFYLILLGTDIVAPMGVEYSEARRQGLAIFAYRDLEATPSPAATYFARNLGIAWHPYHGPQEFIRHFEQSLIERLIAGTPGYGLDLRDIELLSDRLAAIEGEEKPAASDARRGASRGGVILPSTPE